MASVKRKGSSTTEDNETVSFRLRHAVKKEHEVRKILDEARGDESIHEYARRVVMAAVASDRNLSEMKVEMAALGEEVKELRTAGAQDRTDWEKKFAEVMKALGLLRGDVATAARALLTAAGKVEPDEAEEWVMDNLLRIPGKDEPK